MNKIEKMKKIYEIKKRMTEEHLDCYFKDMKPIMFLDNRVPVYDSTALCCEGGIKFAALVKISDNEDDYVIITDCYYEYLLDEQDRKVVLAHEMGHYYDIINGLLPEDYLEREIRADSFAASIYGKQAVLDLLVKFKIFGREFINVEFDVDERIKKINK